MPATSAWPIEDRTIPVPQAGASAGELPSHRLILATALATCVVLVCVSALLLARRLSGHFEASLSSLHLLSVGVVLLAVVAALRLAGVGLTAARGGEAIRAAFLVLPAIALFMLGVSVSFLSAPVWPLAIVWLAILAEEGTWWTIYFRGRRVRPTLRAASPAAPPTEVTVSEESELPEAPFKADEELVPSNVVQQMTRVREENGLESLHGLLRGFFAAGERNQNLHLAFCPPLSSVPEISFEQIDGPPATIKAAQVESFGARLEVRLDAALDEPADVLLEFACHELKNSDFKQP